MADDLTALEDWAGGLLDRLGPSGQRTVAKAVAVALRRSQQQRIARQQNPDGSPYQPRKRKYKKLRGKSGRIKREKMFTRLRQSTFLKARAEGATAVVAFTGHAAGIAQVHQDGATDRVSPKGPRVRYPRRVLLGFTDADRVMIRDLLIDHLTR